MGYVESLAEIVHRKNVGTPKARPSVYKGVAFRSRLEVRFAFHLDLLGETWVYEPRVYGPKGRGYLPDFEIIGATRPTFIELKPTRKQAEAAKAKVAVIWETHPGALIIIAAAQGCTFYGSQGGPWVEWQERWVA